MSHRTPTCSRQRGLFKARTLAGRRRTGHPSSTGATLPGVLALACGLVVALPVSIASAQNANGESDGRDTGVLRGPAVERPEGVSDARSAGRFADADRASDARSRTPRAVLHVVGMLGSERMPENLRLDEDQRARVRSIMAEHNQAVRAHLAPHRERLASLIEQAGLDPERARAMLLGEDGPGSRRGAEQTRRGDAPRRDVRAARDADRDRSRTPQQVRALRELRELLQAGPSFEPVLARVRAVLTEDQRQWFDQRLKNLSSRQSDAAPSERRGRARSGARTPGNADAMESGLGARENAMPGVMGVPARGVLRSPRLASLLEQLDAQEQDRIADLIERYLERRRGSRPAPPSMDEVDVPDPK